MIEERRIRPIKQKKGKNKHANGDRNIKANIKTPFENEINSKQQGEMEPILTSGASEISVPLSGESIYAFKTYAAILKEWNSKMNLTGIVDDQGIALRHFVDSLTLVPFIQDEINKHGHNDLSLIDVGTGAGFPGIPVKVAMPNLQITLLDALRKRISFLQEVCKRLEIENIKALHMRAEDAGHSKTHREKYDIATARAVASLPVLCELCLPMVKIGGAFMAMKGSLDEELQQSEKAIVAMGATIETVRQFQLPGSDMQRAIVVIRKIRPTPAKYPRKSGKPEKEPIL